MAALGSVLTWANRVVRTNDTAKISSSDLVLVPGHPRIFASRPSLRWDHRGAQNVGFRVVATGLRGVFRTPRNPVAE